MQEQNSRCGVGEILIRRKSVQPGSIALNNERKIAEAIAVRSAELRASLATIGKEHNAFLLKCAEDAHAAKAVVTKTQKQLTALKAGIASATSKYYDEKRSWINGKKENEMLRAELADKLQAAKAHAEAQLQKAQNIEKLEATLKGNIAFREINVERREQAIKAREAAIKRVEAMHARDDARISEGLVLLSEKEKDYASRVNALVVKEKRAEAVLVKEAALQKEEARIDIKAQLVQEKDKALGTERTDLARKRALLGRARHLKNKGAAK
jgi:hypothetical protein